MDFVNQYWEIAVFVAIFVVCTIIYSVATRNRGSFVDTPDWSKVVRRIIELAGVFLSLVFIVFLIWKHDLWFGIIALIFPILGFCSVFLTRLVINWIVKRKFRGQDEAEKLNMQQFRDNLSDHLVNAIILTVFFLSGLLIILITIAKIPDDPIIDPVFLLLILDLFASIEFSFLMYQIYYLIIINNVPSEEIIQIVRICKNLNE